MMDLFSRTEAPQQVRVPLGLKHATWYTWNPEARELLAELPAAQPRRGLVRQVKLQRYRVYNNTYTLDLGRLHPESLHMAGTMADRLRTLNVEDEPFFFHSLMDTQLTSAKLRFWLAAVRARLAHQLRDPMAALCAPLMPAKGESDFPLHCDLFIPKVLWNIFDGVETGSGGASLFMRVSDLERHVLPAVPGMPGRTRKALITCLQREVRGDQYDRFYNLLYDDDQPWSEDVVRAMKHHTLTITLHKGMAYMIHDRRWMHGRGPTTGVHRNRLHRLVFNTAASRQ